MKTKKWIYSLIMLALTPLSNIVNIQPQDFSNTDSCELKKVYLRHNETMKILRDHHATPIVSLENIIAYTEKIVALLSDIHKLIINKQKNDCIKCINNKNDTEVYGDLIYEFFELEKHLQKHAPKTFEALKTKWKKEYPCLLIFE